MAQTAVGPDELMRQAQAQFDVGHGREAVALYNEAARAFAAAGNLSSQMRALHQSGETLRLIGEPTKATPALAKALALARQTGDGATEAQVLPELAEAASDAGDLPTAISANRDVLSRAEAAHDGRTAAFAAARLGDALLNSDQPAPAAEVFARAATLFHAADDPSNEIVARSWQGRALERAEQYLSARDAFQRSATLAHSIDDPAKEADALKGVGDQQYRLGDYAAAVENFDSAIRLARRAGDRGVEGWAELSLGVVRYFQDQTAAAVEAYDAALEAARATKNRGLEGEALGNLAGAYGQLGQYDKAEGYFRQDIAIAREQNDRLVEGQALGNLWAHRDAEAIEPLSESRDIAASLHYQRGLAIALRNLGMAQYRTGALAAAEASLRRGVDVQDALRSRTVGADRYNISLFNTQLEAYAYLQAVLVAEHQPEAALEISERGRGRALADMLSARSGGPATAPQPTIAEIRAVARTRGATLVEYSMVQADSALYVWVVRPEGKVAFQRITLDVREHGGASGPLDRAFQSLVRDTRATLGALGAKDIPAPRQGDASADDVLSWFHRLLIAPIANLLPAKPDEPVVLIPQGVLFLLPFAALRDAEGKPLIAAHALSVAPSIQTLDLLGAGGGAATGPPLVAGNPALGPIRMDPGSDDETVLPPLPEAEREARVVAELLGGQALVGLAATRKAVVERMARAGTIHLATHGIAEDVRGRGQPGALAFAPDPDSDGLMTTGDVMRLRLHADLVVLSACNTGLGNLTGDGVIGLSRAFLAAGARSVIVSLWYVPDQATAELMETFYRALARTHNKAAALRAAMLETQAKHPNPLAWAGFFLVGDLM